MRIQNVVTDFTQLDVAYVALIALLVVEIFYHIQPVQCDNNQYINVGHAQIIFQNNAVRYVLFQVNAFRLLVDWAVFYLQLMVLY